MATDSGARLRLLAAEVRAEQRRIDLTVAELDTAVEAIRKMAMGIRRARCCFDLRIRRPRYTEQLRVSSGESRGFLDEPPGFALDKKLT